MSLLRGDPAFDEIQRIDAFHHCSGERQAFFQAAANGRHPRSSPATKWSCDTCVIPTTIASGKKAALDSIDRHIPRLDRHLGISTEAFAIFV
jgi:hypothetical protein